MSRRLSIFVDESGDFGNLQLHSPYYIVTMLFHDQKDDITFDNTILDTNIRNIGFDPISLHSGPIIRREGYYRNYKKDERKKLLRSLLSYCQHVPIHYTALIVEKKECTGIIDLTAKLSKLISTFVKEHLVFFQEFDEIIVYYDNGQIELTRVLTSTLTALISNVSFRLVKSSDYKLFQLADMLCTLELVDIKFQTKTSSRSELDFFHSQREFKRNYIKVIRKKRLD
ncbi:MAG: DUF3800 domain-containing protein [Lachnospiraceae bacterium]|nr:DUF3800 domain-containing protein [Lachnospiraceae bacterium]